MDLQGYTNKRIYNQQQNKGLYISQKSDNLIFNIIIRFMYDEHSENNDNIKHCIGSVLNQTLANYKIYVIVDDKKCLPYLKNYNKYISIVSEQTNYLEGYQNIYLNKVLNRINGWVLFLDPFNTLRRNALLTIFDKIKSDDDFCVWKYKKNNKTIFHKKIRKMALCTIAFHTKHLKNTRFVSCSNGVERFLNSLITSNTFNFVFIERAIVTNSVLTNLLSLNDIRDKVECSANGANGANGDKKFIFIIPSYNNDDYYEKNLNSIINQTYKNWHIVYVDDASTDNTYINVTNFITKNNILDKFTLLHNIKNMKQSHCRFRAYKEADNNDILCFLDGDDWLFDKYVLDKLNHEYRSNIKLTYGSYYKYENNTVTTDLYSTIPISNNYLSDNHWVGIHLRTGYAYLYKNMPESYYKDHNNNWMSAVTDVAEFYWAVMQVGNNYKEIKYPTYVYNIDSSKRFSNSIFNIDDEQSTYRKNVYKKIVDYHKKRDFNRIIRENHVENCYISPALKHFTERFLDKYTLGTYDITRPMLFFGIYCLTDIEILKNHNGPIIIVPGGSDVNFIVKCIQTKEIDIDNVLFIAISKNIFTRLETVPYINIHTSYDFSLVDENIFYPRKKTSTNNIYIYDGYDKNYHQHNSKTYNKPLIDELYKRLNNKYEFIFSSQLGQLPNNDMPTVYEKCFIGIRLTANDGNANTVQEFAAMQIPIIHNQSEYGIKWNSIEDIINHIDEYYSNNSQYDKLNEFKYDFYKINSLNDFMLSNINKNIDRFTSIVSNYKRILFICGDYPGYGGAATNCDKLQKYFNKRGHKTFAFYYNFENDTNAKLETNENYIIGGINSIHEIDFIPDLIILKSFIKVDIRKIFKCPVFFLVGGIYVNNLDKYYHELNSKKEQDIYINKSVLQQIDYCDHTFVNSYHTQKILYEYYNKQTYLFYSSFINYVDNALYNSDTFKERKYEYGLIISNFKRPIKNVIKSIEFLKDKKNVILIGKGSSTFKSYGFECVESVDNENMNNYYKEIKYIVQDSFYESCSNVKIESLFNGCKFKQVIVISSTQYPGFGGSATNAYQLILQFRKNGYNVAGVFFNNDLNVDYNPDNIDGIFIYKYDYDSNIVKRDICSYLHEEPNMCLAKNYLAPKFCKNIFNCYTVYLVSGINHFRLFFPEKSALEILDNKFSMNTKFVNNNELFTNQICDKIVCNSLLTKKIYTKIYPEFIHKISNVVDTTSISKKIVINSKKIYDIIVVCSNLSRKCKNNSFLVDVLKQNIFNNHKIIIVGDEYTEFQKIHNVICTGLLSHNDTISTIAKSKILLLPSFFDSNSNTVREAYNHKCIPIITKNIGFSELFPKYFICNNFEINEWTNKILVILNNYDKFKHIKIKYKTSISVLDLC